MKNPVHFQRAEELNLLFDSNPPAAVDMAIDLINQHQLNRFRLERRMNILPTRMDLILTKERHLEKDETERFVTLVIEQLAELGIPLESET